MINKIQVEKEVKEPHKWNNISSQIVFLLSFKLQRPIPNQNTFTNTLFRNFFDINLN